MTLAKRWADLAPLTLEVAQEAPAMIKAALKNPAPASSLLGLEILTYDVEEGTVGLAFEASAQLQNKWGGIQGGLVGAMLDEAISFSAGLNLEWGQIVPTLEIKISFLEAARPGRLYCEARSVRRGKSILFLEADIEDSAGKRLARASSTVSVVTLKPRD